MQFGSDPRPLVEPNALYGDQRLYVPWLPVSHRRDAAGHPGIEDLSSGARWRALIHHRMASGFANAVA
jgi:hypothetical protein